LDGLATTVRFGSSPDVKKLQAEIRDVAAQLREALLPFDPGLGPDDVQSN
jgi:hypothetical protein